MERPISANVLRAARGVYACLCSAADISVAEIIGACAPEDECVALHVRRCSTLARGVPAALEVAVCVEWIQNTDPRQNTNQNSAVLR